MTLTREPAASAPDPLVIVRAAGLADGPFVLRCLADAFGVPAGDYERAGLEAFIEREGGTLVIELAGERVGTVRVDRDGDRAGIYGFAVSPEFQGRGIGRQVLASLACDLPAQGVPNVSLEVSCSNDAALRLYLSCGFDVVGTEDYYSVPVGRARRPLRRGPDPRPRSDSARGLRSYEGAIGLDWYSVDPNLSLLLTGCFPTAATARSPRSTRTVRRAVRRRSLAACRDHRQARSGAAPVRPVGSRRATTSSITRHGWRARLTWCGPGSPALPYHAGRPVPAVVTAALAYLVCQAETAIYCGLGMTGGRGGHRRALRARLRSATTHARPPDERSTRTQFWDGGMFLTERQGGSDVGANTTRAVRDGAEWRLYGEKHFCSNVDAEVVHRPRPPRRRPATAARGLATFIVPRRLPDGSPNGFRIKRLKPKLGTTAVPTGEVTLDGARRVAGGTADAESGADGAGDGRGINTMMEMVNGSRFGVAVMGLGIHRRSFLEAAIYAAAARAVGPADRPYPLVRETLVDLLVDLEAGAALTFECAAATRLAARRRGRGALAAPHPRPARQAPDVPGRGSSAASQALEIFGGNGYMEDWPMARQLRDAQCHTIWEGTENICASTCAGRCGPKALRRRCCAG